MPEERGRERERERFLQKQIQMFIQFPSQTIWPHTSNSHLSPGVTGVPNLEDRGARNIHSHLGTKNHPRCPSRVLFTVTVHLCCSDFGLLPPPSSTRSVGPRELLQDFLAGGELGQRAAQRQEDEEEGGEKQGRPRGARTRTPSHPPPAMGRWGRGGRFPVGARTSETDRPDRSVEHGVRVVRKVRKVQLMVFDVFRLPFDHEKNMGERSGMIRRVKSLYS